MAPSVEGNREVSDSKALPSGRAKKTQKAVRFIEPESSDNKNETSTNTEAQATGRSHSLPRNMRLYPEEIKRRDKVQGESKSQRRRSFTAGKHDESTESLL